MGKQRVYKLPITQEEVDEMVKEVEESVPQDHPIVEPDINGALGDLKKALHSLKFNGYVKWMNHWPGDAAEIHIQNAINKLKQDISEE